MSAPLTTICLSAPPASEPAATKHCEQHAAKQQKVQQWLA